jgi:hypothetical protein
MACSGSAVFSGLAPGALDGMDVGYTGIAWFLSSALGCMPYVYRSKLCYCCDYVIDLSLCTLSRSCMI